MPSIIHSSSEEPTSMQCRRQDITHGTVQGKDGEAMYSSDKKLSYAEAGEKAMAIHSGTLAWKIPWTEEPGRLQSMGLLRVRFD